MFEKRKYWNQNVHKRLIKDANTCHERRPAKERQYDFRQANKKEKILSLKHNEIVTPRKIATNRDAREFRCNRYIRHIYSKHRDAKSGEKVNAEEIEMSPIFCIIALMKIQNSCWIGNNRGPQRLR